ncbi:SCO4848 family membrane protein [Micromonospora sp. NPDC051925]|uniref:SCO4848 family membrane protein n=1 Tax=Micromonospora sp. NPDC051925 TaxID=3364288 RepID=UPI0037CAD30E
MGYSSTMVLSRRWAFFLVGVGVWTWLIWPRLGLAIWHDTRAWAGGAVGEGAPTGFFWVHALLIGASLAIGTTVGVLGVRGWRAVRRDTGQ